MTIKDGKIISATTAELRKKYIEDEIYDCGYDFEQYLYTLTRRGVEIVNEEEKENDEIRHDL